jgi:hypothetical protein
MLAVYGNVENVDNHKLLMEWLVTKFTPDEIQAAREIVARNEIKVFLEMFFLNHSPSIPPIGERDDFLSVLLESELIDPNGLHDITVLNSCINEAYHEVISEKFPAILNQEDAHGSVAAVDDRATRSFRM